MKSTELFMFNVRNITGEQLVELLQKYFPNTYSRYDVIVSIKEPKIDGDDE